MLCLKVLALMVIITVRLIPPCGWVKVGCVIAFAFVMISKSRNANSVICFCLSSSVTISCKKKDGKITPTVPCSA